MEYRNETITALATPPGKGAIAIIRISGIKALNITEKIFRSSKSLSNSKTHTMLYGYIFDNDSQQEIDQVLIGVFKSPNSFTGENMAEIYCHGGTAIPDKILSLLIKNGARLAHKGEFTKRAFLNGKIDLTQAEAVNDIIQMPTLAGSALGLANLKKSLSEPLDKIKNDLGFVLAKIEAGIDHPEEEVEPLSALDEEKIRKAGEIIHSLLDQGALSRKIAAGFRVVLAGKTNVGKSSLLNCLSGEEKAIVSHIHGTTRDVIEVELSLEGIPVILIDTAGIRDQVENEIEGYGIVKSIENLKKADLVLFIFDPVSGITEEDKKILKLIDREKTVFAAGKKDLGVLDCKQAESYCIFDLISFSASTKENIDTLIQTIKKRLGIMSFESSSVYVNQRQDEVLKKLKIQLGILIQALEDEKEEEILAFEIKNSLEILGEILGFSIRDDLLDTVFANFCLGK
ncbi:MAG TPA: tRNA uridine-5-carboxymethylaminomethyl(34) synthesis GTPase MnmE [Spirochaetia bacterium]|nr:MAG: tRNA uridine-5-carboxymethylaminomethyl(34) synthesis GTPase MnmE [Spirochaetes bacterium GWB1_36_13]HCL57895.1 tRNA uridine-5-carboxymethylaminomethyl(34) synthesis GTPase MnmE [Spirochaetia bacterium]